MGSHPCTVAVGEGVPDYLARRRALGRIVWAGPRADVDEERLAAAYLGGEQAYTEAAQAAAATEAAAAVDRTISLDGERVDR